MNIKLNENNVLITIFFLLYVFSSATCLALSKNEEEVAMRTAEKSNNSRLLFVVGIPANKQASFQNGFDKSDKKFNLIGEAKLHLKKKDYPKALEALNKAMTFANSDNASSWNIHWHLVDVYEAMGDRESFVKEIDWLIAHCENEKTKQDFIARKQKFLETHKAVSSKSKRVGQSDE